MAFVQFSLPDSNSIRQISGSWNIIESDNLPNGFLISDFNGNRYVLNEYESESQDVVELESSDCLSEADYKDVLSGVISEMHAKEYDKIVISRKKFVHSNKSIENVFKTVIEEHPDKFCYCIQAPNNEIWIGASPETLMSVNDGVGATMALAGTQKNTGISLNDYVWNTKEKDEHQYVIDYLAEHFNASKISFDQSETATCAAGSIVHLRTQFKNIEVKDKLTQLIKAIHPTPAVCGIPLQKTKSKISEVEVYDREYYTGFIGVKSAGQTNLYVNLRCMKKVKNGYELFIGGGITKDSIVKDEWIETEMKGDVLSVLILE